VLHAEGVALVGLARLVDVPLVAELDGAGVLAKRRSRRTLQEGMDSSSSLISLSPRWMLAFAWAEPGGTMATKRSELSMPVRLKRSPPVISGVRAATPGSKTARSAKPPRAPSRKRGRR
jgi:hypothetical protein